MRFCAARVFAILDMHQRSKVFRLQQSSQKRTSAALSRAITADSGISKNRIVNARPVEVPQSRAISTDDVCAGYIQMNSGLGATVGRLGPVCLHHVVPSEPTVDLKDLVLSQSLRILLLGLASQETSSVTRAIGSPEGPR